MRLFLSNVLCVYSNCLCFFEFFLDRGEEHPLQLDIHILDLQTKRNTEGMRMGLKLGTLCSGVVGKFLWMGQSQFFEIVSTFQIGAPPHTIVFSISTDSMQDITREGIFSGSEQPRPTVYSVFRKKVC